MPPALPGDGYQKSRLWPSVEPISHPRPPLTLGVRHLCGGAMHPCSGCGIRPGRQRAALRLPTLTRSRGRTLRLGGASLVLRGWALRVGGEALARRGRSFALCVPVLPACLNAYALTIFLAGPAPGLMASPGWCADALSIAWGTGCTTGGHGALLPHTPAPKPSARGYSPLWPPGLSLRK